MNIKFIGPIFVVCNVFAWIFFLSGWPLSAKNLPGTKTVVNKENLQVAAQASNFMKGAAEEELNKHPLPDKANEAKRRGRTIKEWLTYYEKHHGINFIMKASIESDTKRSEDFARLPLDAAMPALLEGYDFFLQYGTAGEGASKLQRVYIFPPKGGSGMQPSRPALAVVEPSGTPASIAEEIREARNRSPYEAEEVVSRALDDDDENNRNNTLQIVHQEGVPLSSSLLEKVLFTDPSELVRASAFEAMMLQAEAEMTDPQALINLALDDPSPLVQYRAQTLQEALESSAGPFIPTDNVPIPDEAWQQ